MSSVERPRRSRSRSPAAESLISKVSKSSYQSNAQRQGQGKDLAQSPSPTMTTTETRISVHVGELLMVPEGSYKHSSYAGSHSSRSRLILSPGEETASIISKSNVANVSKSQPSPSHLDAETELHNDSGNYATGPANLESGGRISVHFTVPPSPLDHFDKWFPQSPTEAPEVIATEQPRVDKTLPLPPYHVFDQWKKRQLVVLVSLTGILSPLSNSIYFPALVAISKQFKISTSVTLVTITVYMVVQAIAPFFWMPFCGTFGRRPVFIATLLVFIGANIGLIFAKTALSWMILRGVQSFGNAALTATCASVIGDISTGKERSKYIGLFGGSLMFTFVGPTIGGILTYYLGFQSIFWFLMAFGISVLILIILILPETLRSIAGNGTIRLGRFQQPLINLIKSSKDTPFEPDTYGYAVPLTFLTPESFVEPLFCLKQKAVLIPTLFGGVVFAICTTVIATTTTMFEAHYSLSYMYIGLAFLPAGAGSFFSFFSIGYLMDHDLRVTDAHYRKVYRLDNDIPLQYRSLKDFPIERARLRNMWWITLIFILSTAGYGFPFKYSPTKIAIPLILQFFIASSATAMLLLNGILIADMYKGTQSVTPAVNCVRFLMAGLAVGTVQSSIDSIGTVFTFGIMASVMLALTPILLMQWFFGKPWIAKQNSTWPREKSGRMPDL